ncbi:UDP-glucose 4-epimerase GalE [Candidatus Roizmanbacteria bacterium RIFCSPHIGHO2_02_FULL_37_13b]|uniref:UDP-glucose 4-epimerase n=1 Tax=Candidatus Roizmanbacteria bacterium RIFCSPLOWO2_02_FULL_36_11 TaxID=1802071 RepID=A0A1F7JD30_9BACT|nr:MAG: UDP-glucose 4-epimerase GalE [Candidatus Roizmanbacteria bacterium RIFCSPHIGHO2_02_FULL_37_13b]OGK53520.1 MAG: UDP-glucose 4-epimerase GalE [Candidatus Roizmanbacteria bacterium RIFCSPLOWO2_02_FULL_36_11]
MKKIIITGAGGYIGSISTYLFLKKGFEVVAIDNFSTGFRQPLEKMIKEFGDDKLRFYSKDLTSDLTPLFKIEKNISAVIHYAASASVDESMHQPQKYFYNNCYGSLNLLQSMINFGINKIIFSSTCAVYGDSTHIPIDENHSTEPLNPYGESKLMTEKMISWFGKLLGIKYVILRYFNVAGALDDGEIGDSKKPSVHLIQNVVRGTLKIAPFYLTCPEVDTPDRSPIRDYVNVVDLNEAHIASLEHLEHGGKSEIINLGTGRGYSVLEIVSKVKELTGAEFELRKTAPRQGEYAKMIASTKKAKDLLKWSHKRSLDDTIDSLIKWYKKYPNGWSS